MSTEQVVVQLPDFFIEEIIEEDNQAVLRVRYIGPIVCPACGGSELRLKDSWTRRVRHHPIGDLCSVLEFRTGKYRCSCGRYFHPRYPGILKHQRSSESFRKHVGERHEDGHCLAVLSRRLRLSWATIERHYRHVLSRRAAEVQGNTSPRILGIDEHFFTKKKGFATTFVNLRTHKVQEVVLGRSEASLGPYLRSLKDKVAHKSGSHGLVRNLSQYRLSPLSRCAHRGRPIPRRPRHRPSLHGGLERR